MNDGQPKTLNIKSVRVDKVMLHRVLDTLDSGASAAEANQRQHERLSCRGREIILYTNQTERNVAFIVPARNISCGGLSFLHGQMMHVGQTCCVDLATRGGGWLTVNGEVVRCRHVNGMIHEIGLKFDNPISLEGLQDLHEAPSPASPASDDKPK